AARRALHSFPTRRSSDLAGDLLDNANRLATQARAPLSAVGRAADSTAELTARLNRDTVPQLNATLEALQGLSRQLEALAAELKRSEEHTSELQSRFDLVC